MPILKTITPLKRFFRLLGEEKSPVYSIYFYAVLNGIVTLSLPLGIQAIFNFILGGRVSTSWVILVLIVGMGVAFGGYMQISQLQIAERLQQRLFSKVGLSVAYRLPRIKSEVFHGNYAPELINRFFEVVPLQKGIAKILIEFSTAILQVSFGLLLLSFYHPTFIIFSFILFVLLALIFYFTGPKGMETAMKESTYKYETAYWLEEVGRAVNTFKLVGNTKLPILKVDKLIQRYLEFRTKHFSVLIFQYKIMIVFKVLIVMSLLISGSLLLIDSQISLGQFVAAEVIIVLVVNSVEKLILSLESVYDTLVAVEKLGQISDLKLENYERTKKKVNSREGALEFHMKDVVFHPSDMLNPILDGVNLEIKAGEKVVLTGKGGKSAILAMLSGLYSDYSGKIDINGLALDLINLEKYRGTVGACLELDQLFHGTIKENILVGREYPKEDFKALLELVGLTNFIYQLPEGADTMLKPEGKGLFKRQALAILIARALVGAPRAIMIENTFERIDLESQQKVLNHLFNGPWTLLMVSVQEEILKRADKIISVDNGTIDFQGTYSEYRSHQSKKS